MNFRYAPTTRRRRRRRACGSCCGAHHVRARDRRATRHPGPVTVTNPLVDAPAPGRRTCRSGAKQAWTPVAEFADRRRGRGQPRTGRPAVRSPGRRARRGGGARADRRGAARVPDGRGGGMKVDVVHLSPGMRAVAPYPFEELDRRKAAALAAGRTLIDFGVGDPREVTAPFIRDALTRRRRTCLVLPAGGGTAGAARRRVPRGSIAASACPSIPTTTSCRSSARRRWSSASRSSVLDRGRRPRPRRRDRRRGTRSPSAVRGGRGATSCGSRCARRERVPAGSRRRAPAPPGTGPPCCGSTTRTTRPAPSRRLRSTGGRPSSRATTGSCWPPTRPTASCGSRAAPPRERPAGGRPLERRGDQHASASARR